MTKASFQEFVWIWHQTQSLETPEVHLRIARWLEEAWRNDRKRLLLQAFRNAGKSTLVGLFGAWLFTQNSNIRVLVLAADLALARKMVRNVKRIIERHPLTPHLKPEAADQWASEQFTVNRSSEMRDPSMLARGISGNVTGSRADVIICDDVEVPKTCDSLPKREDLREKLREIDYILVPGGTQLYIGTPHTFYSIYADKPRPEMGEDTPFLNGFDRLSIPLLDWEGTCAWPSRFPPEKVEEIRRHAGPNKFASQMLLEPVNASECRLDPDRLRVYHAELDYRESNGEATLWLEGRRLVSASCWWDPAYGAPDKGDASVIAALFTDSHGGYWLHRIRYLTHDPARVGEEDEATQLCRQVADFVRDAWVPAVTVETNGLGRFLPGLLRREFSRVGLRAAIREHRSEKSKDLRILDAFDPVLAAGALNAHRSVWETPFVTEMREWQPRGGSRNRSRDDGLDAVSGCLLSEPVRLPRLPPTNPKTQIGAGGLDAEWRPGAAPQRARTDFEL